MKTSKEKLLDLKIFKTLERVCREKDQIFKLGFVAFFLFKEFSTLRIEKSFIIVQQKGL